MRLMTALILIAAPVVAQEYDPQNPEHYEACRGSRYSLYGCETGDGMPVPGFSGSAQENALWLENRFQQKRIERLEQRFEDERIDREAADAGRRARELHERQFEIMLDSKVRR